MKEIELFNANINNTNKVRQESQDSELQEEAK